MRDFCVSALTFLWTAAVLATPILPCTAFAKERVLAIGALPAPIRTAVAASYPTASMSEASVEVEDGVTTYEVKVRIGERTVDLEYQADGKQLEEEERLTLGVLPSPVQTTVAGYSGWSVLGVERAIAGGVTTYEVLLSKDKKRMELLMDASGVVHEEAKNHESESDDDGH